MIALGGALGAVSRYGVSGAVSLLGIQFPVGTIAVNILGSFVLGVLMTSFVLFWDVSQAFKAFAVVGFLGAFTTFSAFSMDSVLLFERGEIISGAIYVLASVVLSIVALYIGMVLVRSVAG
jgi:CrcB protein